MNNALLGNQKIWYQYQMNIFIKIKIIDFINSFTFGKRSNALDHLIMKHKKVIYFGSWKQPNLP